MWGSQCVEPLTRESQIHLYFASITTTNKIRFMVARILHDYQSHHEPHLLDFAKSCLYHEIIRRTLTTAGFGERHDDEEPDEHHHISDSVCDLSIQFAQ